jgi:uroporphyrinogen-III synthase
MWSHAGVVVTRPGREAGLWVQRLQQAGVPALALPLIDIAPAPDQRALEQACKVLPGCVAVMFVSANAVEGFAAVCPVPQGSPAPRAWATGPGTVAALLRAGWPAAQIDAPADDAPLFDSEALWGRVQDRLRPGQRVLIVRGADAQGRLAGRDWLAQALQASGIEVLQCAAYARCLPPWPAERQAQARTALVQGLWWLFSSSEAVRHLQMLWPELPWSQLRALATHPRIAGALQAAGCTQLHTVPAALPALVASIKSLSYE